MLTFFDGLRILNLPLTMRISQFNGNENCRFVRCFPIKSSIKSL